MLVSKEIGRGKLHGKIHQLEDYSSYFIDERKCVKALVRADSFQWHFNADPVNDFSIKTFQDTRFLCSYEIWGERIMDSEWIFRKNKGLPVSVI